MTPRTRTSNQETNFKVYYSKKVPHQAHFPHRRKVVRRQNGPTLREPKQMKFLPEKMRVRNVIRDSEEEDEGSVEEDNEELIDRGSSNAEDPPRRIHKKRRSSEFESSNEDSEPNQPVPKRGRRSPRRRAKSSPSTTIKPESESEELQSTSSASSSESQAEESATHSKHRRQSTMTQLVNGRRPRAGDEEPNFHPVKRARTSFGGVKRKRHNKDDKQRTLTQMVPGLVPIGVLSDEDLEDDLKAEQASGDQEMSGSVEHVPASTQPDIVGRGAWPVETSSRVQINADADDEDDEDEYQPTQDVYASAFKRRRTSRRVSENKPAQPSHMDYSQATPRKCTKTRFSLLATPERRKIREIASSQSPAETPLSTQSTPGSGRLPLRERSVNRQRLQDTPSKRKRVTFQEPIKEQEPVSSNNARFGGIVPDSEDDEDDLDMDDDEGDILDEHNIEREETGSIYSIENPVRGRDIGADTQAMLQQIDEACRNTEESAESDLKCVSRDGDSQGNDLRSYQDSPELGERRTKARLREENTPRSQSPLNQSAHVAVKHDGFSLASTSGPRNDALGDLVEDETAIRDRPDIKTEDSTIGPSLPELNDSSNVPSTPLRTVLKMEDEDEEVVSAIPLHIADLLPHSTPYEASLDLDGVPRSSPICSETQDTTVSHSSQAKQQLQSEWHAYSQYANKRALPSSSMQAVQEGSSYQQATPFSDPAIAPRRWSTPLSQATTIDVTQRSPRVLQTPPRRARAADIDKTPTKLPNISPLDSPQRPPTLVIASSYPSPGVAELGLCSSPVMGRTQLEGLGSIEDFTIPLPPPMSDSIEGDEL